MRGTRVRHKEPNDLAPSPFFDKERSTTFFEKGNKPFFNPVIQPKLNTNEPGDVYEQQADNMTGANIQRKKKDETNDKPKPDVKDKAKTAGAPKKPTAADMPKLTPIPSMKDSPCACLVVVHNEERNVHLTADLMHKNCSYNLAMVNPDSGERTFKFPAADKETDPNELFDPEIAAKCRADEDSCRDFMTNNSDATDLPTIKKVTQMQFFLSLSDCSNAFTLPVVALHNNNIDDTQSYREKKDGKKDKVGVEEFEGVDIDKTVTDDSAAKDTKVDPKKMNVQEMKDLLLEKFKKGTQNALTETPRTTNIFRWCSSPDLSHCHIGDPHHPDNVTWVTNEEDFKELSKKDINVVFQSTKPAKKEGSKAGESDTDLSTLFLTLKDLIGVEYAMKSMQLMQGITTDIVDIVNIQSRLTGSAVSGDMTIAEFFKNYTDLLMKQWALSNKNADLNSLPGEQAARLAKLRYLNIESPIKKGGSDDERIRNYEVIVEILKARGLHCCDDPAKAEENVKQGLKIDPKKEPKKELKPAKK